MLETPPAFIVNGYAMRNISRLKKFHQRIKNAINKGEEFTNLNLPEFTELHDEMNFFLDISEKYYRFYVEIPAKVAHINNVLNELELGVQINMLVLLSKAAVSTKHPRR